MRATTSRLLRTIVVAIVTAFLATPEGAGSVFGINAHIPSAKILDRVEGAGMTWVRIDFLWSRVETEPDIYDWSVYDALLDRLEDHGVRVYATIASTPAWATGGSEFSGVPDDPDQWQEICYLAAARYRGRIDTWGLWNEPNLDHFWEGTRNEFIDIILVPGAAGIRAGDPDALMAAGDLAHLSSAHWEDWMRRILQDGRDLMDIFTHHLYPSHGFAWEVTWELDSGFPGPFGSPSIREVLQEEGWWGRPFWLTETGVESAEYGEGDQADFYRELLNDWFGQDPQARWMDRIFFYEMSDGAAPPPFTFGIIHGPPDFVPKPAYDAYRDFIAAAAVDDAEVLSNDAPAFIAPGAEKEITVLLHNTGSTTWSAEDGYFFEASPSSDEWLVDAGLLPPGQEVPPDDAVEVTIRVFAPTEVPPEPTRAVLTARMIDGYGRLFGDALRATLVFTQEVPPELLAEPVPVKVREGESATFHVAATSETPLSYRWRRNSILLFDDENVTGSDSSELRIDPADRHLIGVYDCILTNAAGNVVTGGAALDVEIRAPRRSNGRRLWPVAGAGEQKAP